MFGRSLRARLAWWYAVVFAAFLSAVGGAGYVFLAYSSLERVDEFLAESGETLASAIEFERHLGAADSVAIAAVLDVLQLPGVSVRLHDRARGPVAPPRDALPGPRDGASSPRLAIDNVLDDLLESAPAMPTLVTRVIDERPVRVLLLPYDIGNRALVVGVAQVMTARTRMLRDARWALGIGLPVVLLLASAGGWWLAGRGFAPVDVMSRRAREIGATNLHERIPVVNPADEIGRLATTFNELLERLERSFEAQARFAADASHELRTPLAIINGEADLALARDDRTRDDYVTALRTIRQSAHRLRAIVGDLFLLARADAGEPILNRTPLHLRDLAEDSAHDLRSLAAARQASIEVRGVDEGLVLGDETLLRRAIDNLVVNAIKYGRPGGVVVIDVSDDGPRWRLDVRDDGAGIPAEVQARLFERFFRADAVRASSGTDGAGLGLAICRRVAREHGGDVVLAASTTSGSTFRLTIPRAPASTLVTSGN
ncbi:MAG: HAMP domain-containing protein [Gemmatimonadaceae bacterium]|nr:HAMP domain-containing protein [Gemmatimonadaceae bacterium]